MFDPNIAYVDTQLQPGVCQWRFWAKKPLLTPTSILAKQAIKSFTARRHEEATDVFQQRYRLRGGLEGTNSGLKWRTGLGQLRVRGKPRVSHAIYLIIAGWNIQRATVCEKNRDIVYERANAAIFDLQRINLQLTFAREVHQRGPRSIFSPTLRRFAKLLQFQAAA